MALGVQQKFAQDRDLLQKHFYEVSRALHPDRFTTSQVSWKQRSLERMSFLNEAYRTLRDPSALRDYVLSLYSLKKEGQSRGKIPVELAESWFDLQDALSENPEAATGKIQAFQGELANFRKTSDGRIRELEIRLDGLEPSAPEYVTSLQQLSQVIDEQSYLQSLTRDVQRLAARSAS